MSVKENGNRCRDTLYRIKDVAVKRIHFSVEWCLMRQILSHDNRHNNNHQWKKFPIFIILVKKCHFPFFKRQEIFIDCYTKIYVIFLWYLQNTFDMSLNTRNCMKQIFFNLYNRIKINFLFSDIPENRKSKI